jgi:hypothetical protein
MPLMLVCVELKVNAAEEQVSRLLEGYLHFGLDSKGVDQAS